MADVFISYSSPDNEVAQRLTRMLERDGLEVFYDREALVAGESFSNQIQRELQNARAVVVLLSRNSKRDKFVEEGLRDALEQRDRVVVPVLLDEGATENWIWPLVSKWQAIKVESNEDLSVVEQAIVRSLPNRWIPPLPVEVSSSAPRFYWLIVIVAIVSALVGAIVVWLLKIE
ncbi:MAG TPA: toll/interleukin-1 receptor domain-containing protein [Pyrinomonadaceae bacterium]|nr:toll/interleukin-1 receptor domain-containing protein [Pyrinomonadaceae bacterium]